MARITENLGAQKLDEVRIRTQFSAEVLYAMKGSAKGIVTVSMAGGYYDGSWSIQSDDISTSRLASEVEVPEGYLLETGKTYMFAAPQ